MLYFIIAKILFFYKFILTVVYGVVLFECTETCNEENQWNWNQNIFFEFLLCM